jgi:hypothetical protein
LRRPQEIADGLPNIYELKKKEGILEKDWESYWTSLTFEVMSETNS